MRKILIYNNKTINITDIILGGPYAFNYYVNSTTTIGNILRKKS